MRRFVPILVAGLAYVAIACSDSTAPTQSTEAAKAFVGGDYAAKNNANPNGKGPKPDIPVGAKQLFTIPAAGGPVDIGPFTVTFPANSVCEPKAGYGKRFWGEDCATLDRDVTLEAAFWVEGGELFVEFLRDLRFDPTKTVTISVPVSAVGDVGDKEILYWSRAPKGRQFFRENTSTQLVGDQLQRRIYHFSGYVVGSGRECTENCEEGQ